MLKTLVQGFGEREHEKVDGLFFLLRSPLSAELQ